MYLNLNLRIVSLYIGFTLALLAFSFFTTTAQETGGRISYGDTVSGRIMGNNDSSSTPHQDWVFRGKAGEIISITVSNPDIVGRVILMDELGVDLGEGTYDGSSYILNNLMLPVNGGYTIEVYGSPGDYNLSLQKIDQKTDLVPLSEKGGQLVYNRDARGRSTKETYYIDTWKLSGQRGDVISIHITEMDLENHAPVFILRTQDGAPIAAGDERHPIESVTLPITGNYVMLVLNGGIDYYLLSVNLLDQNGDDGVQSTEGGNIEYGRLAVGKLNVDNNFENVWTLEGKGGDLISIHLQSISAMGNSLHLSLLQSGFDQPLQEGTLPDQGSQSIFQILIPVDTPYTAYGATSHLLTFNAAQGRFMGPDINEFKLPKSGTYRIVVTGQQYNQDEVAAYYELIVKPSGRNVVVTDGGSLEYGFSGSGEFTDSNHEDKWKFTGNQGDIVTISMKRLTGNLVADFEIFGPDGTSVGVASTGAELYNAEIADFQLSTSGTYTIVSRAFSNSQHGTYSVNVTKTN